MKYRLVMVAVVLALPVGALLLYSSRRQETVGPPATTSPFASKVAAPEGSSDGNFKEGLASAEQENKANSKFSGEIEALEELSQYSGQRLSAGDPIVLYDTTDMNRQRQLIIPLFDSSKKVVKALGVYDRDDTGMAWEFAILDTGVDHGRWRTYPPITTDIAREKALQKGIRGFSVESKFFSVEKDTPFYEVLSLDGNYFINAHSGEIVQMASEPAPRSSRRFNDSFEMHWGPNGEIQVTNISLKPEEFKQLQEEIAQNNREIKAGLLQVDDNFNVVLDNRP